VLDNVCLAIYLCPRAQLTLSQGIPDKGALLSTLSAYWFSILTSRIPSLKTHFLSLELPEKLAKTELASTYRGRSMQVRRLKVVPIESIVRGYITGGAWSEYKKSGTVHGAKVQEGLRECEQFDKPIWTPSTKAEPGEHDENISPAKGTLTTPCISLQLGGLICAYISRSRSHHLSSKYAIYTLA
jgi:phosphoribosylaminoimidazole-succinocarboxamide synthase